MAYRLASNKIDCYRDVNDGSLRQLFFDRFVFVFCSVFHNSQSSNPADTATVIVRDRKANVFFHLKEFFRPCNLRRVLTQTIPRKYWRHGNYILPTTTTATRARGTVCWLEFESRPSVPRNVDCNGRTTDATRFFRRKLAAPVVESLSRHYWSMTVQFNCTGRMSSHDQKPSINNVLGLLAQQFAVISGKHKFYNITQSNRNC